LLQTVNRTYLQVSKHLNIEYFPVMCTLQWNSSICENGFRGVDPEDNWRISAKN